MSGILDLLSTTLGGDRTRELTRQLGTDEGTTRTAVEAALPTLLSALSRNAARPQGAEALHRAITRDHDGAALEEAEARIKGGDTKEGDGILRHVFGARRAAVETGLSQATGLEPGATNKLCSMLAPIVMGALGREQRRGGLDAAGLAGLLSRSREEAGAGAPRQMGILERLLDADGDGDTDVADFIKHGQSLLGRLGKR